MIKLNIGCGPNIFPFDGWTNYDCDDIENYVQSIARYTNLDGLPEHQKKLIIFLQNGGKVYFGKCDINDGFKQYPDNSVDLIYLGQMIEHLNYFYEVPQFLRECFRILKPSGVIRLTTPDLDLLIHAYLNNEMDKFAIEQPSFYSQVDPSAQLSMLMYGASGPNCKRNNYEGHFFLYTKKSMMQAMERIGFKDIEFYYESGKSKSDIMARECVDAGLSHSFICEGTK